MTEFTFYTFIDAWFDDWLILTTTVRWHAAPHILTVTATFIKHIFSPLPNVSYEVSLFVHMLFALGERKKDVSVDKALDMYFFL